MRDIGANIRILRMQRKITQEELAQQLFITRQAVSSYETGRTHPDIDMLVKIAEVLETDTNTLLYGPQRTAEAKRSKREFYITLAAALLLGIIYVLLNNYLISHLQHQIVLSIPQNLMRITILPAMWFLLGWALMQGVLCLPGMPAIRFQYQRTAYIASISILCAITLLQLPYVIYFSIAFIRSLTQASVKMSFPNIPIYTPLANRLLVLTLRAGAGWVIWGAGIRFLKPITQ